MDSEYQNEEWRDIEGYEGLYQASSLGRIKSFHRGGRMLRLPVYGDYLSVCLSKDGASRRRDVHRVIAEVFHGAQPPNTVVHHKDENKWNNASDNLEYVSISYNVRHKTQVLGKKRKGMKLDASQVWEILRLRGEGMKVGEIARLFNISEMYTSDIVTGKAWKHLPGRPFFYGKPRKS